MQKKQLIILVSVITIILIGASAWLIKAKFSKQENVSEQVVTTKPKKRLSPPQNVLPFAERPVVSLQPFTQAGGRFVSIQVQEMRTSATQAEYEIIYDVANVSAVSASGAKLAVPANEQEGGQQAFMGELSLESLPTKTNNRFGTCSAGGACINHEVKQGLLVINFNAQSPYGVSAPWYYFQTGSQEITIEALSLNLSSDTFKKSNDFLLMQAMGLPAGLADEVISLPDTESKDNGSRPFAWQLRFTNAPEQGTMKVVLPAEHQQASLHVYDGKSWTVASDLAAVPLADGYFYALSSAN